MHIKRNVISRITALFLAVCMIIPTSGMAVFAEAVNETDESTGIETSVPAAETEAKSDATEAADETAVETAAAEDATAESDAASEAEAEVNASSGASDAKAEAADENNVMNDQAEEADPTEADEENAPDEAEKQKPAQNFSGVAAGITVKASAPEGVFPADTKMKVKGVSSKRVIDAVDAITDGEVVDAAAVDITFYDKSGREIQPDDNVKITLSLDGALDGETYSVVHIKDNGTAEAINEIHVDESSAAFEADSFSIYAIIGEDGKREVRRIYTFYQYNVNTGEWFIIQADGQDLREIVRNGEELYEPAEPASTLEKDDRKFDGWFYHDNDPSGQDRWKAGDRVSFGTVNDIDTTADTDEEVRIDAVFEDALKVEFFDNNDPAGIIEVLEGAPGDTISAAGVNLDTEDDVILTGWIVKNRADEELERISTNGSVTLTNLTLRLYPIISQASWVHFDSNASDATSVESVKVAEGKNIPEPTAPTRPGYEFDGWYTAATGGTKVDFSSATMGEDDVTYYAHWTAQNVPYRVFIWREVVGDVQGRIRDGVSYELVDLYSETAPAGTTITYAAAEASYRQHVASGDITGDYGFCDEPDMDDIDGPSDMTIHGDGTTIVNAYFKRHEYTLTFDLSGTGRINSLGRNVDGVTSTWTSASGKTGTTFSFKAKVGEDILDRWPKGTEVNSTTALYNGTNYTFDFRGWYVEKRNVVATTSKHILTVDYLSEDSAGNYTDTTFNARYLSGGVYYNLYYWLQDPGADTYTEAPGYRELGALSTSTATFQGKSIDGFTCTNPNAEPSSGSGTQTDPYVQNFYYERQSFDLNFNNMDTIEKTVSKQFGADISDQDYTPAKPAVYEGKDYYKFGGWYLERQHLTKFDFSDAVMPQANLTLYALWEKDNVNVTFDPDNGEESTAVQVEAETTINAADIPANPTREGYVFGGWHLNGQPVNLEDHVFTEDTTLKAHWIATTEYTIIYQSNQADEKGKIEGEHALPYEAPFLVEDGAHMFVRRFESDCASAAFLGWQLPGSSAVYHENDIFTVNASIMANDQNQIILTAVYGTKVPIYTGLTFDGNGGKTASGDTKIEYTKDNHKLQNSVFTTPTSDDFVRPGYKLVGWSADQGADTADFDCGIEIGVNNNDLPNVLYAVWEPDETTYMIYHMFEKDATSDEYSTTFYTASGESICSGHRITATTGDEITLTASDAEDYAGYTFKGFTTDGADKSPDTHSSVTATVAGDASTTIYIYYDLNEYSLTYTFNFDPDGDGTDFAVPVDTNKYHYGEDISASDKYKDGETYHGYKFSGWEVTSPDGVKVTDGTDFVMPAANVTLLGTWTAQDVEYKIEYYLETLTDGEFEKQDAETVTLTGTTGTHVSTATTSLEDGSPAEKEFTGFTLDKTVTDTVSESDISGDGDTVLKLYYTRNSYMFNYYYRGSTPSNGQAINEVRDANGMTAEGKKVKYGKTVNVYNIADVPGYTFYGWYGNTDLDTSTGVDTSAHPYAAAGEEEASRGGSFTMPAGNVALYGAYEGTNDAKYWIKHYTENLDSDDPSDPGNYTLASTEPATGLVDGLVYAQPITDYHGNGFTYNQELTTHYTGTDAESLPNYDATKIDSAYGGSTKLIFAKDPDDYAVIAIYYSRNSHKITYQYTNSADGATDVSGWVAEDVKYGQTVQINSAQDALVNSGDDSVSAPGYTFSSWQTYLAGTSSSFDMPDRDVVVYGSWTANEGKYKIYHKFEQTPDAEDYDSEYWQGGTQQTCPGHEYSGKTGDTVTLDYESYAGYTPVTSGLDALNPKGVPNGTEYRLYFDEDGKLIKAVPTAEGSTGTYEEDVFYEYYDLVKQNYTVTYQYPGSVKPAAVKTPSQITETYVGQQIDVYAHDAGNNYKKDKRYDGYIFQGWDTTHQDSLALEDKDGDGVNETLTMPLRNVTLNGSWKAGESMYRVEVYLQPVNGSTDLADYERSYYVNKDGKTLPLTTADNEAWLTGNTDAQAAFTSPTSITGFTRRSVDYKYEDALIHATVDPAEATEFDDDMQVVKLYYDRNQYTVSYSADGKWPANAEALNPSSGDWQTKRYYYGQEVTVAKDAAAKGYTFDGWHTNPSGTYRGLVEDDTTSFTMPAGSLVLFGHFEPTETKYKVEYYLEKADGSGYELTYALEKDGDGYKLSDDTNVQLSGTSESDAMDAVGDTLQQEIPHFTYKNYQAVKRDPAETDLDGDTTIIGAGTLVIKVYYTRDSYNVKYEYGNKPEPDTAPSINDINTGYGGDKRYDSTVNAAPEPKLAGWEFSGWSADNVTISDVKTFKMPGEDVTLTGTWTAIPDGSDYTVRFYYEEGDHYVEAEDEADIRKGTAGTEADVSDEDKVPSEKMQEMIKTAGGRYVLDEEKNDLWSAVVSGSGSTELRVYFKAAYEVIFDANGHGTAPDSQEVFYGDKATQPDELIAEGYVFDGWYTDKDCSDGSEYDFDTPVKEGITLYAKWKKCDPVSSRDAKDSDGKPVKHDPPVRKTVTGDKPEKADTFVFELKAAGNTAGFEENPMPEGSDGQTKRIEVKAGEEDEFGEIIFTMPGTYKYTAVEINNGLDGYTYDESVYTVEYVVTQNGSALEAKRIFQKDGKDVSAAEFAFENTYKAEETPQDGPEKDDTSKDNPKKDSTPQKIDSPEDETSTAEATPNTGDDTNMMLWLILLCGTLIPLCASGIRRSRNNRG